MGVIMIITYRGDDSLLIKCKEGTITTNGSIKINDFDISENGEYEVGGIIAESVEGIYTFQSEDINLTFIKRNKALSASELEIVKDTDILFVPISEIMDAKTALEVANQIEPRILIPFHYKSIEEFSKIEGIDPEFMDTLKITKNQLPEEERKVIALHVQK
jgi:L-ascorbate metabolism protein UlaG (beta-lactamase superfamily)